MLLYLIKKSRLGQFEGFVFEEKFNFKDILDYECGNLCFVNCVFCEEADFSKLEFVNDLEFKNCTFLKEVSFKGAVFKGDLKIVDNSFNEKNTEDKIFINAEFKGQTIDIENNQNFPRLDGALLNSTRLIFKCSYFKDRSQAARVNYTIARLQAEKINDLKYLSYYAYCERQYTGALIDKSDFLNYSEYFLARILGYIARYFMGYGEHISRLFFTMVFVISVFAAIYMNLGVSTCLGEALKLSIADIRDYSILELIRVYIRFWYFSFMTFSTVGFGDMAVNTLLGEILVCIEVFIGVVVQGIWMSLIIKKMFK